MRVFQFMDYLRCRRLPEADGFAPQGESKNLDRENGPSIAVEAIADPQRSAAHTWARA